MDAETRDRMLDALGLVDRARRLRLDSEAAFAVERHKAKPPHVQSSHGRKGPRALAKKAAAVISQAKSGRAVLDAGQFDLSGTRRVPGVSDAEMRAVNEYSDDAQRINSQIRRGTMSTRVARTVRQLDRLMSRSRVEEDVEVWRGSATATDIFGERVAGDLTGFEWTEDAFVSTSADRRIAAQFAGMFGDRDRPVLMRVVAPSGTGALTLSGWEEGGLGLGGASQAEVLLERGLRFRVLADRSVDEPGIPGKTRVLDVEVVGSKST